MFSNFIKYLAIPIFFLFLADSGNAQVQLVFQPALYGKSLNGLMHFQVVNNAPVAFSASIRIVVSGEPGGRLVEIVLPRINIRAGINMMGEHLLQGAKVLFGNSSNATVFRQTGKLTEGEYEYCYELNVLDDKPDMPQDYFENCFELNLAPLTPLLLMDPMDKDTICNQKPSFTWQSPLPVDISARYRLMVAEIKQKQTPAEALSFNTLAINQPDIPTTYMIYPPAVKELDKNKTYAWQVYYSVNGRLLLKSEIWTFTVQCEDTIKGELTDSYRELKSDIVGDYYVARRKLRFSITNPYNAGELKYKILSVQNTGKPVKHLPVLKITTGFNAYEIDLSEYHEFENDKEYRLEVELITGQKYYLRFTYKD